MTDPFTPKQLQYITHANAKYNLAHGAVRSGKTVCTLFRFMKDAFECPGSSIYIMGYSLSTIYRNVVSLLFESPELKFFAPYCTWSKGDHTLLFGEKKIKALGAGDEGALGIIQGLTIDLALCDEMTLYPENVIDMIDTRLSREHSKLHAAMNPKQPDHKIKQWIDKAEAGNQMYYSLHFSIDDNDMFLPKGYKENLRENLKGLFFKRNFLGLWCMAEGAIFDFFDRKFHVSEHELNATEYFIAGIDYGTSTVFACVLVAVATNFNTQGKLRMRVVKEYYWNVEETKRQKTNSEYLRDMKEFLDEYNVKAIYIDPNAASFKLELQRAGMRVVDGNNDVLDGIQKVSSLISDGILSVKSNCKNLVREIEGYVWDTKKGENGLDAPVKKWDHACLTSDIKVHVLYEDTIVPMPISCLWDSQGRYSDTLVNFNLEKKVIEFDLFKNVVRTRKNAEVFELELEDGKKLKATGDHKILTERGYIELQYLTLSDLAVVCNIVSDIHRTVLVQVKSIRKLDGKRDVYCLATENNGNMVANGIVVKNCDALRYAVFTHKPVTYKKPPEPEKQIYEFGKNKFDPWNSYGK